MNLILDRTNEVREFLNEKGFIRKVLFHGWNVADRIIVLANSKRYVEVARSGFPFQEGAIDYRNRFKEAKLLLSADVKVQGGIKNEHR